MDKQLMSEWIIEALKKHGGKAKERDLKKYIWDNYKSKIETSEFLLYNWQEVYRWTISQLRRNSSIKRVVGEIGTYALDKYKFKDLSEIDKQVQTTKIVERAKAATSIIEPVAKGEIKIELGHNNPPETIKNDIVIPQKEWRQLLRRIKKIENKPNEARGENISSLKSFAKKNYGF
ncbi:MAG TPA: hypothetical protein DIS83_07785, partial [Rhodobiaceae bacterium]|nr:hypothetical protein [Rhodobiaceae bacterium]